jgi:SHS family lactate transporter-like MFS transporter
MVASASAQVEATGGDHWHLKTTIVVDGVGETVDDYARVQGILIGTVSAYIIFLTIIGPECVLLSSLSTL